MSNYEELITKIRKSGLDVLRCIEKLASYAHVLQSDLSDSEKKRVRREALLKVKEALANGGRVNTRASHCVTQEIGITLYALTPVVLECHEIERIGYDEVMSMIQDLLHIACTYSEFELIVSAQMTFCELMPLAFAKDREKSWHYLKALAFCCYTVLKEKSGIGIMEVLGTMFHKKSRDTVMKSGGAEYQRISRILEFALSVAFDPRYWNTMNQLNDVSTYLEIACYVLRCVEFTHMHENAFTHIRMCIDTITERNYELRDEMTIEILSKTVISTCEFIRKCMEGQQVAGGETPKLQAKIFEKVADLMQKNIEMFVFNNRMRNTVFTWVVPLLRTIHNDYNVYKLTCEKLLNSISKWLVTLDMCPDMAVRQTDLPNNDVMSIICQCCNVVKTNMKKAWTMTDHESQRKTLSGLHMYIDIQIVYQRLSRSDPQVQPILAFIDKELRGNKFNLEKQPAVLMVFKLVQHYLARKMLIKYSPDPETLWKELTDCHCINSARMIFISAMISCLGNAENSSSFLDKDWLPLLLLPCVRKLRETFGTKWDNLRLPCSKGNSKTMMQVANLAMTYEAALSSQYNQGKCIEYACLVDTSSNNTTALLADAIVAVIPQYFFVSELTDATPLLMFVNNFRQHRHAIAIALLSGLKYRWASEQHVAELCDILAVALCDVWSSDKSQCQACSDDEFVGIVPVDNSEPCNVCPDDVHRFISGFMENRMKYDYKDKTIRSFLKVCRGFVIHVADTEISNSFGLLRDFLIDSRQTIHKEISAIWQFIDQNDYIYRSTTEEFCDFVEGLTLMPGKCEKWQSLLEVSHIARVKELRVNTKLRIFTCLLSETIVEEDMVGHCDVAANGRSEDSRRRKDYTPKDLHMGHKMWAEARRMLSSLTEIARLEGTAQESRQLIFTRYSEQILRVYVTRIFEESDGRDDVEWKMLLANAIRRLAVLFDFPSIRNILDSCKAALICEVLHGALDKPQNGCVFINMLIQEFFSAADFQSGGSLREQRYSLVIRVLPDLILLARRKAQNGTTTIWDFCRQYCNFHPQEFENVFPSFRKQIMLRLLTNDADSFLIDDNEPEDEVVRILRQHYEGLHRGRQFSIASIMDYKNEGPEFLQMFRRYFVRYEFIDYAADVASSLRVVLTGVDKKFINENWWSILMALRHSPADFSETTESWIHFIDLLDYGILRTHVWRLVADVSNVLHSDVLLQRLWQRLQYSSRYRVIDTDAVLHRFLWVIPQTLENEIQSDVNLTKLRKLDDALSMIAEYDRYPSVLVLDQLRMHFERGLVRKEELPRLVSALVQLIVNCRHSEERGHMSSLLNSIPAMDSEKPDESFVRWDQEGLYFLNPDKVTQELLDDCAVMVENLPIGGMSIDFADRSMCDLQKLFRIKEDDEDMRKSFIEGVVGFYSKMASNEKPRIDLPTIISPETYDVQRSVNSYTGWLSQLCAACIGNTEQLFSLFRHIAHVSEPKFLCRLLTRLLLSNIVSGREEVTRKIRYEFKNVLLRARTHHVTRQEREPTAFVFYFFEFLYFFFNLDSLKKDAKMKEARQHIRSFWIQMLDYNTKQRDHKFHVPLIVEVAEIFGMEQRCILWMELFYEMKTAKDNSLAVACNFTLLRLYARLWDLNGVRGAYARICEFQTDHLHAEIILHESRGDVKDVTHLYELDKNLKKFDAANEVSKRFEEFQKSLQMSLVKSDEDYDDCYHHELALSTLCKWIQVDPDYGASPQTFERNIESRAAELFVISSVTEGSENRLEDSIWIWNKMAVRRMEELAIGGGISYQTALPYLVQLQSYDEVEMITNATAEDVIDGDSMLWKALKRRTNDCDQRLDILEPILRMRSLALGERLRKATTEDLRDALMTHMVDTHLHNARVARLHGCVGRAQTMIMRAKLVNMCDKRIVLEEARLKLQTSEVASGMKLLDNLLASTFGELTRHFGDTQQNADLGLRSAAKREIELFPCQEKNLYSEVQTLRIAQMIKSGDSIGFDKVYEETTNLLTSFVSSGVMYEAAWHLDYLFHSIFTSKSVLPLLKAYREVAKYEKKSVLRARAIERMTALWLSHSKKLKEVIDAKRSGAVDIVGQMRTMEAEMTEAVRFLGWQAFYPAFAILVMKIDHPDAEVFYHIKKMMVQLMIRLPHQCLWQSIHLLRAQDSLKTERYKEVLSQVKHKSSCLKVLVEQYDFAATAFKFVGDRVKRADENKELSKVAPQLKLVVKDGIYDPKELEFGRRNDAQQAVISGLMAPVLSIIDSSVDMNKEKVVEEPSVSDYASACELDDHYRIHAIDEKIKVLSSKTEPILIGLVTASGRKIQIICKKDDDLSKDYHFTKMVEMCNDLLTKDERTRIQNMHATTYSVIPLAKTGGIIEFLGGVVPYYDIIDEFFTPRAETSAKWRKLMDNCVRPEQKVDVFKNVCCKDTPLVMAKWFRKHYPEAGKWFTSRRLFAKSTAVMSIIGFLFGLGDRHTKNVMIEPATGKCVHVDFDSIFDIADFCNVPEVVPFRLTRNMINGMGDVAMNGEYRSVCEHTLRVCQENAYQIEKFIADLPDLVSGLSLDMALKRLNETRQRNNVTYDMKAAKRLVSARLRGQIASAIVYPLNTLSNPMKVEQLVSSLIEMATSDEKLAEMYIGWMPMV